MKRQWVGGLFALVLLLLTNAAARADAPNLDGVAFQSKLTAQVPLTLQFQNERNQRVTLGEYFGKRPVILTLNYLRCENLCPLELQDLAAALAQLNFTLGDEFDVVTVSIDPRDTPIVAANKRQLALNAYAGADTGWHFLTGDDASIKTLAQSVGFQYVYDAASDEYAHPLGIIVLTPRGQVARYLYGIDYSARDLRLALVEASQNKIGTAADQILLFCFHYDATAGRYTAAAWNAVQLGAGVGFLALGGFLLRLWRAEHRAKTKNG
jgi:protein SCO1/2